MTLRPTKHAQRRMAQRRIAEAEILEVLAAPETSYTSREDPRLVVILGRTSAGRRLKLVVVAADPESLITVADRDE